jgi:hypothetical protein
MWQCPKCQSKEPKVIADELLLQGIPVIPDKLDIGSLVAMCGCGAKVRVRQDDLPKAQACLTTFVARRSRRPDVISLIASYIREIKPVFF